MVVNTISLNSPYLKIATTQIGQYNEKVKVMGIFQYIGGAVGYNVGTIQNTRTSFAIPLTYTNTGDL